MIHTVKGFSVVNEAEVDVFLDLSCFRDSLRESGSPVVSAEQRSFSVLPHIPEFTLASSQSLDEVSTS